MVEGHRLLTCRDCGELALPLAAGGVQTAPEYRRERTRKAPYALYEAFFYVFRGRGIYVIGSYLAVLAVLAIVGFVPVVGALAGCFSLVFVAMVLFLVPGTLTMIVRDTAAGENELSEWPDFSDFSERFSEVAGFLITALIAGLPLVLMLKLGECLDTVSLGTHCWLILFGGWFLAMALWVPSFGAISVLHNNFLAFRLAGHARVLARFGAEFWVIVLFSTILIVAGQVVSLFAMAIPFFGLAASAAAGMYGWFTAAHFIGIFFRRNTKELGEIYGPW